MSYWAKNQKDTKQKKVAKDKPLFFFVLEIVRENTCI